jgi:single-strand DNA-binding protein
MTMNKALVIGNVGNDPEMRYTPNGNPVTSFNVATNRRYTTSEGEQREETEWFRVNAWNRLAETCNQYVTKGMKVYVEGRLTSSPYISRDGEPRAGNEIAATDVKFLDRPERSGAGPGEATGIGGPGSGPGSAPSDAPAGAPPGAASGGGDVEDLPW